VLASPPVLSPADISTPAATPLDAAPPAAPLDYNVCFFLNQRHALHKLDCGVTLAADRISASADGQTGEEQFSNITAVHLQTSGGKTDVESCEITFADGNTLTVLNCDAGGFSDSELAANYRAFVRDLHTRLAAGGFNSIRFTEGWPMWRCSAMLVLAACTALLVAYLGLWTLFCTGDLKGFAMVALGGYGAWRWYRISLNNLPRDYTPDRLPEFLVS
jgi:hypothetical protein